MNQNGCSVFTVVVVAFGLTIYGTDYCAAQLFQADDNLAQQDDDPKQGGYISEFLSQRSGESGVFGFIGWMLSKHMWRDFGRYVEKKIQQQIEALMNELGEEDLSFHTLDVFSQPLVFV